MYLMCAPHWRLVNRKLQRQLWSTFVDGQQTRKDPSAAYLIVQERCVCAVAIAEGLITEDEARERIAARGRDAEVMAESLPIAHQLGLI